MIKARGYAVKSPTSKFEPFSFERREPTEQDVVIEISHCGICHSDIHQARNEWNSSTYPMVPGHEIVGKVLRVGAKVQKCKVGDPVGVGCMVDSCRTCNSCKRGLEQFCDNQISFTYNSVEQDRKTPTYGGYSSQIVVHQDFVLKIANSLPLAETAPLLCAGITTYSPLKQHKVGPGQRVGVVGLGGLGHMGIKFAVAMGAEVTVFSTSASKKEDAIKLGAHHFVVSKNADSFTPLANHFDFILDTVSAEHDINLYLSSLRLDGTMVMVGVPEKALALRAGSLILRRRTLTGSLIGGIAETQEMLDFCAAKKITSEIELMPIQKIEEAYDRILKSEVRYRFVIDMKTL